MLSCSGGVLKFPFENVVNKHCMSNHVYSVSSKVSSLQLHHLIKKKKSRNKANSPTLKYDIIDVYIAFNKGDWNPAVLYGLS